MLFGNQGCGMAKIPLITRYNKQDCPLNDCDERKVQSELRTARLLKSKLIGGGPVTFVVRPVDSSGVSLRIVIEN